MKFLVFIFFLSICSECFAENKWLRLNSPTGASLRNCSYVDPLNAWAAGDSGIIIHTSDGGNNFVVQNSTINFYISDLYFVNKRLGWVIANESVFEGAVILKTTNGGLNWSAENFFDSTYFLRTIYFPDSLTGFVGGFQGAIFKTTDAGITWARMKVDSSEYSGFPISRFKFATAELGFACGGYIDIAGVIWRTTNGGELWTAEAYSPEPFYDFYIMDEQKIVSVGGDFEFGVQISKTFDAGLNWNYQSLAMFGQAYSADFRTPSELWMALGYAQAWAVSNDSGSTWTSTPTTDSTLIYAVSFADSLHGLAFGADGAILKYSPMTNISIQENENLLNGFLLYQNYPNPFNPVTKITFTLPHSANVKLNIYDVSGKKILSLLNESKPEGIYEVEWNAADYASGVYIYDLEINGEVISTRRMILLK